MLHYGLDGLVEAVHEVSDFFGLRSGAHGLDELVHAVCEVVQLDGAELILQEGDQRSGAFRAAQR
eukprot:10988534-Heterocapsa_arctica.AAC.1